MPPSTRSTARGFVGRALLGTRVSLDRVVSAVSLVLSLPPMSLISSGKRNFIIIESGTKGVCDRGTPDVKTLCYTSADCVTGLFCDFSELLPRLGVCELTCCALDNCQSPYLGGGGHPQVRHILTYMLLDRLSLSQCFPAGAVSLRLHALDCKDFDSFAYLSHRDTPVPPAQTIASAASFNLGGWNAAHVKPFVFALLLGNCSSSTGTCGTSRSGACYSLGDCDRMLAL